MDRSHCTKLFSVLFAALAALLLLAHPSDLRADTFDITFIDVTFSAPCYHETQNTCSEVINGTAVFDVDTQEATDIALSMTGTLNASLDGFYDGTGTDPCVNGSSLCTEPAYIYDLNALPADNAIEFNPTLPTFDAPSPTPLESVPGNETVLFIPGTCGGDVANCQTTGDFPSGDFTMTSGSYTSIDVSPEPGTILLFATGLALTAFLTRRRFIRAR